MVELCGARLVPGTLDEYPEPAEPRVVPLRHDADGAPAGRADRAGRPVEEILARLGFEPRRRRRGDGAALARRRREREVDLIEEVARIHGLDKLPTTLPVAQLRRGPAHPGPAAAPARSRTCCATAGSTRRSSYSFTPADASPACGWATWPSCG